VGLGNPEVGAVLLRLLRRGHRRRTDLWGLRPARAL